MEAYGRNESTAYYNMPNSYIKNMQVPAFVNAVKLSKKQTPILSFKISKNKAKYKTICYIIAVIKILSYFRQLMVNFDKILNYLIINFRFTTPK